KPSCSPPLQQSRSSPSFCLRGSFCQSLWLAAMSLQTTCSAFLCLLRSSHFRSSLLLGFLHFCSFGTSSTCLGGLSAQLVWSLQRSRWQSMVGLSTPVFRRRVTGTARQ